MSQRTEMTENGLATYSSPDFRTYEPVPYIDADGNRQVYQLCETYEDGRWEAFTSLVGREQTYERLMAQKQAR